MTVKSCSVSVSVSASVGSSMMMTLASNDSAFGDLYHLLFTDGEIPESGIRAVLDAKSRQQTAGTLTQPLVVDAAKTGARFAAEEDIGGNRQFRQQVQLLVDDADPLILRVAGPLKCTGWPR